MKLSDYLIAKQLSPAAFARLIDVGRMSVHRYLHGDRFPRPDVLHRIHEATDGQVSPSDFLTHAAGDTHNDQGGESQNKGINVENENGRFPWSRLSADEQQAIEAAFEAMMREPQEGDRHSPALEVALQTLGQRVRESNGQFILDDRPVRIGRLIELTNDLRGQEGLPPLFYPGAKN